MKTSPIGWCDYSGGDLNFVTGCTPISEGCAHCYARVIYDRYGRDFSQVTFHEDKLRRLRTKRFPQYSPKRGAPHRPMAFVCDTGDLFHESLWFDGIMWAFDVFAQHQDVIWQVLTKRPERMLQEALRWCEGNNVETLPANVWLGVTAENQERADERIPILLDTPAAVRFVSIEPMLGPVDLCEVLMPDGDHLGRGLHNWGSDSGIDWVVAGAESGPKRRPFDVQWAVDLYEQCREGGVKFFGKQDSGLYPGEPLVLPGYGVVQEWPGEGTQ